MPKTKSAHRMNAISSETADADFDMDAVLEVKRQAQPSSDEIAMANLLARKNVLRKLPSENFESILARCFKDRAAKTFYDQMEAQLDRTDDREGPGDGVYISGDSCEWSVDQDLYDDLDFLRSLPGSDVFVVKIIISALEAMLQPENDVYGLEQIMDPCERFDKLILEAVRPMGEAARNRKGYDKVAFIIATILSARQRVARRISVIYIDDGEVEGNPSFLESIVFLAKWHAQWVGKMLANKTAGQNLPPELVEAIGEHYAEASTLDVETVSRMTDRMPEWLEYLTSGFEGPDAPHADISDDQDMSSNNENSNDEESSDQDSSDGDSSE